MLLKIIFGFTALVVLFLKATKFMVNEYYVEQYFGNIGSGKTPLISALKLRDTKLGFKHFYTNANIEGFEKCNPLELVNSVPPEDSVFYIDEIGIVFNNRNYKNFDQKLIEFFKLCKHYKIKIVTFSQAYDDSEITIRRLAERMYIMRRFLRCWTMVRRIRKKMDITNNKTADNEKMNGGQIIDVYKYSGLPKFYFLPRWINFIDSYDRPDRANINAQYIPLTEKSNLAFTWKWYPITIKKNIVKLCIKIGVSIKNTFCRCRTAIRKSAKKLKYYAKLQINIIKPFLNKK